MIRNAPPAPTELEVTIFGPGIGECIVIHLGNGQWMVVDSCMSRSTDVPVALEYLRELGVDVGNSVVRIVATHWHDDHIRGLATLLRECSKAEFVMSLALANQQFFQLVLEVDAQNRLVTHNSSASEFAEILGILKERARSSTTAGPHTFAQDGARIFHGGFNGETEVWALSPSAATVTNAMTALADRLLTKGSCRRFRRLSANDLSVALLVRASTYNVLLGADLENTSASEFGWKAVLASTGRPKDLSHLFKIPHHGSPNADHEEVWTSMLVAEPATVVTPYAKLSGPLPRQVDIDRIKNRTSSLYCTTWPVMRKPPRRQGVDGIIRGATKRRRVLTTNPGHVRLRFDLGGGSPDAAINLFGSARSL